MATGPEHYRRAEALINGLGAVDAPGTDETRDVLALAQVHATLALAAATALSGQNTMASSEADAWWQAAGLPARTYATSTTES